MPERHQREQQESDLEGLRVETEERLSQTQRRLDIATTEEEWEDLSRALRYFQAVLGVIRVASIFESEINNAA